MDLGCKEVKVVHENREYSSTRQLPRGVTEASHFITARPATCEAIMWEQWEGERVFVGMCVLGV